MKRIPASRQHGFTIVELLIVIVVIAILATISIVTYDGVQQRARNLQNTSLAKSFGDALTQYLVINGSYPPGTTAWPCLGKGPYDVNGDTQYDCVFTGTTVQMTGNSTFNNAMRSYTNVDMKVADFTISDSFGKKFMGAQIWYMTDATLDGQPHYYYMNYIQTGQGTCSYGRLVADVGAANAHVFSSVRPATGYTWQDVGGRHCLIALPNPNTL